MLGRVCCGFTSVLVGRLLRCSASIWLTDIVWCVRFNFTLEVKIVATKSGLFCSVHRGSVCTNEVHPRMQSCTAWRGLIFWFSHSKQRSNKTWFWSHLASGLTPKMVKQHNKVGAACVAPPASASAKQSEAKPRTNTPLESNNQNRISYENPKGVYAKRGSFGILISKLRR